MAICRHSPVITVGETSEKQESIVFLTNHHQFGATTIAAIYKDRWQGRVVS